MSESLNGHYEEFPPAAETVSRAGILSVIERWTYEPRANDEGRAAFALGSLESYGKIPELQQSVDFMVDIQGDPDFGPGVNITDEYLANLWFRSAQYIRMSMADEVLNKKLAKLQRIGAIPHPKFKFPKDYFQPEAWSEIYQIVYNHPYLQDQFEYKLGRGVIQTNYYDRYLAVVLAIAADRDKPTEGIAWADFGTSIGLGPRGLIAGEQFSPMTVYRPVTGSTEGTAGVPLEVDIQSTRAYLDTVKVKLPLKSAVGFDLTGVNDPSQQLWVKSSHYWKELNNQNLMKRFDRLAAVKDPRVKFYQANLSEPGKLTERIIEHSIPKVDYVSILTMRHQLKSQQEYEQVIANAVEMLNPGGKIIESDFIHPSIWTDWSYVTTVRRPFSENPDPTVEYVWRNARCGEVIARPLE